jgi:hypothetical protein
MAHDAGFPNFETRFGNQIPNEERCPGEKVMINVIHAKVARATPVIQWQDQDRLSIGSEDSAHLNQLSEWLAAVLERMVRDDDIDRGGVCVPERRHHLYTPGGRNVARCLVRFDSDSTANIEFAKNSTAAAAEIETHVAVANKWTEPTGGFRAKRIGNAKLPGRIGLSSTALVAGRNSHFGSSLAGNGSRINDTVSHLVHVPV